MTARDRTVLSVVFAVAVVAAAWFLLLAPTRKDAKSLSDQIAGVTTQLQASKVTVAAGEAAQAGYRSDYAAVARLGKAVPADDDVPSLVYQLESASRRSRVDFRSIELSDGSGAPPPAAAAPAAQVAAVGAAEKGQAAPTGATGTSGTTGATGTTGAAAPTAAAAPALPPDTVAGAQGFPTMPFDFAFGGSFFRIKDLLARLDRFTRVQGGRVSVNGRLLTVDGFALKASAKGFPDMRASLHATAYLLPGDDGVTVGSTPAAAAAGVAQPVAASGSPSIPTPSAAAAGVGTR